MDIAVEKLMTYFNGSNKLIDCSAKDNQNVVPEDLGFESNEELFENHRNTSIFLAILKNGNDSLGLVNVECSTFSIHNLCL